jgi:hypothetical protein
MRIVSLTGGLLAAVSLAACDPAHWIAVQNRSGRPAQVTYTYGGWRRPDTTITQTLAPTGHGRKMTISYGIGGWSRDEVQRAARQLRPLRISSATDTLLLTDSTQLKEFLWQHMRSGYRVQIDIR